MLAISSDNFISLNSLTSLAGSPITNATVSCKVIDSAGNVLTTISLTGGTGGNYSGLLPASFTSGLSNTNYTLQITAVAFAGTVVIVSLQQADYLGG